jgi:CHAT domain-containing protein
MMELHPKLMATITAQQVQLGAYPHLSYSVVRILRETLQDLPLFPPSPSFISMEEKNRRISIPLVDLAGYITYNQNYDPSQVLERMKQIGGWISEKILPGNCLCCCRSGLPQSIEIFTDQHEIPWELTWVREDFLARHIVHTRLPFASRGRSYTVNYSPVPRFAVLIGRAAGLHFAQEELSAIRTLYQQKFGEDITVFQGAEVTADLIRDILVNTGNFDRPFDIVHFIGHAESQMGLVWLELLGPPFLDKYVPQVLGGSPLVFFNACSSGVSTIVGYRYQADVIDSFGARLLAAGASHFIGPLFPVRDTTAKRLAVSFYSELFSGTPVGAAFFKAKTELGKTDPLAYMYVLYGTASVRMVNNG